MGARFRSAFVAWLVPVVLLGGVFAVVQAQNAGAPAKATRWSDPATWPNNKVPAAGDKVAIARNQSVILDVNTPALGGVTIDGTLSFADNADVELTTEWIMLHGELAIGTEARPHTRKATITFTDNVKGEDIGVPAASVASERVDRGIMIMGGTLNLHGDGSTPGPSWRTPQPQAAPRSGSWTRPAGGPVTRSSSHPRISIPVRPSGAPSLPSRATRSRSIESSSTCTSARSRSASMSVAKWRC